MYKIYQILNIDGERYVGSTKQSLEKRYQQHACPQIRRYTSNIVMMKPHTIILIENIGDDKKKALRRERYWIDRLKNCVNIEIPYSSPEQKKALSIKRNKRYYDKDNNREEQNKRSFNCNKKRKEYHKTWGEPIDKLYRDTPNNLLLISMDVFV